MSFKDQDHFSGHADRYEEYPKRISLPLEEILTKNGLRRGLCMYGSAAFTEIVKWLTAPRREQVAG
jgi:hypothetical protein